MEGDESMSRKMVTIDGNQACTHVAYATSEIITIYPITPSTPMAAESDTKSASKQENIWGSIPVVTQMQSEGCVAGALHGSLTTGALCTRSEERRVGKESRSRW